MPQPLTARYVLLVLDDEAGPVAALVGGAVADLGLEADVVACACPDEAVVRLRVGRRYSAVIAGPDHPGLQTVTSASARAATPVVVVDPGATAARLAQVIRSRAAPVRRRDRLPGSGRASRAGSAPLVAVCGHGGTGASVLAAALAADLARRLSQPDVVLADFAFHSDQAVLHGLAEPLPSLLDLLEASRLRLPSPAHLRQVSVAGPGYRLLPGLRRPSHWTAVTARVFETALCGLRAACGLVVADIAGEFEGEVETGSLDVEDRNHMARHIASQADLVAVVGRPGTSGERRLSLTIDAMLDLGVPADRIQPVVNRAAGHGFRDRAILVAEMAGVDTVPFPDRLAGGLGVVVAARLRRPVAPAPAPAPWTDAVPVAAGSIGCWPGSQPA